MLPNFKTMRDILPKSFDKWLSETFTPKKVIFSGPATIVIFEDGVKVVCKCHKNDQSLYSKDRGYFLCILKRFAMEMDIPFGQLYSCFMPKGLTATVEKEMTHRSISDTFGAMTDEQKDHVEYLVQRSRKEGLTDGYEQGYDDGYKKGNTSGYAQGYEHGYDDGRTQGRYDVEDTRGDEDDDSEVLSWLGVLYFDGKDSDTKN